MNDLAKKHNIKWGYRYSKILSIETRSKIYDTLFDSFKRRDMGNPILSSTGKNINISEDDLGKYYIVKPTKGVYEKEVKKKFLKNEYIFEKINELAQLQKELYNTMVYNEVLLLEEKIDKLFIQIFEVDVDLELNIYPFKEKKYFKCFKEYVKHHITKPYKDYGYVYQRMLYEQMIEQITHFDFMKWLENNKYITHKTYDVFLEKGGFDSLSKCKSLIREKNFETSFFNHN